MIGTPSGFVQRQWISAAQPPQYWQCQHGRGAIRPWLLGLMRGSMDTGY
jgi:hypothetical protein